MAFNLTQVQTRYWCCTQHRTAHIMTDVHKETVLKGLILARVCLAHLLTLLASSVPVTLPGQRTILLAVFYCCTTCDHPLTDALL